MTFPPLDSLPVEVLQAHLGQQLSPKDTQAMRSVCRRFAVQFGDNYIWRTHYRNAGLELPESPSDESNAYELAKFYPVWTSLQKVIQDSCDYAGDNVHRKATPRCLCLIILSMPELAPLHLYARRILEERCDIPAGLSVDELFLRVARGDRELRADPPARLVCLREIGRRPKDPELCRVLLSAIQQDHFACEEDEIVKVAVEGIAPYMDDPMVREAVRNSIGGRNNPNLFKPVLGHLIQKTADLDPIIDDYAGGLCGMAGVISKYINSPERVAHLVQRLSGASNLHLVSQLAEALEPFAIEKDVLEALWECLAGIHTNSGGGWFARRVLWNAISTVELDSSILAKYGSRFPELVDLADAVATSKLCPVNDLDKLLQALKSKSALVRPAAAKVLAPSIQDDARVFEAFLDRIRADDFGDVGVVVVNALAVFCDRAAIRTMLIEEGPLTGQMHKPGVTTYNAQLRMATIRALQPYMHEPEVRAAFLKRLEKDEVLRCELMDILGPLVSEDDVRDLFVRAATDQLWHQPCQSSWHYRDAAIEKLASVVHRPEIRDLLLDLYHGKEYLLKAACIRALCQDPTNPLIRADELLQDCVNTRDVIRTEARKALRAYLGYGTTA